MKVTFVGIRNGRPRFEFGDRVPPQWLRDLLPSIRITGDSIVIAGKTYAPGSVIPKP